MMNPELGRLIDSVTPKLNEKTANGYSVIAMEQFESYINEVLKAVNRDFPKGVEYVGCKRCTDLEEYMEVTRRKAPYNKFDTSLSYVYMMKYYFRFNGVDLRPRAIYLPYVTDSGTIYLRGSRFTISPTMVEYPISKGLQDIFVRISRAKMTFKRLNHHVMIDDRRETVQIVHSQLHNNRHPSPNCKAETTLTHYLFCKYGFTETMRRFGACDAKAGDHFPPDEYPPEDWVICSSYYASGTQARPETVRKGLYQPPTIKVAIPRNQLNAMARYLIGGFFYVVDHFPSRVDPSYVDTPKWWMILMGHMLQSGDINEGRLIMDVQGHIDSLDEYVDSVAVEDFRKAGYEIDNLYQFMAIIIEQFNTWVLGARSTVTSLYGKELSVVVQVAEGIVNAIFTMYFKLRNAARKELSVKEVEDALSAALTPNIIFWITRNHAEVSNISYSGDNKALKVTRAVVPQSSSNSVGKKKGQVSPSDQTKKLDISIAEVGGLFSMTKADPDGRTVLNHFAQTDAHAKIQPNPELAPLLAPAQAIIKAH